MQKCSTGTGAYTVSIPSLKTHTGAAGRGLTDDQRAIAMKAVAPLVVPVIDELRTAYAIGDRPLDEADFYRICEGEGIRLCNTPEFAFMAEHPDVQGVYFRTAGDVPSIYLRSFFVGPFDLAIAMHELGHHAMGHSGPAWKHRRDHIDTVQKELEADCFAQHAAMHWA